MIEYTVINSKQIKPYVHKQNLANSCSNYFFFWLLKVSLNYQKPPSFSNFVSIIKIYLNKQWNHKQSLVGLITPILQKRNNRQQYFCNLGYTGMGIMSMLNLCTATTLVTLKKVAFDDMLALFRSHLCYKRSK